MAKATTGLNWTSEHWFDPVSDTRWLRTTPFRFHTHEHKTAPPSFDMDTVILLWLLAALLIVVGFAGLILPAVPGIPLIFAGLLLQAWSEDFAYVGWGTLTLLGVLALLSYGVDMVAASRGAKKFGASPRAVWGAALGTLVGLLFGLLGIMLGPFIGAVVGEFSRQASAKSAIHAGIGATLGLLFGALLKIALAFTMLGVFVVARLL
jgi:uncharacterized protein YqgC (DUF456 family)